MFAFTRMLFTAVLLCMAMRVLDGPYAVSLAKSVGGVVVVIERQSPR